MFLDKKTFYQRLTTYFIQYLSDNTDKEKHIAISGGSTVIGLFESILVNDAIQYFDRPDIYFFWVDERCVNQQSKESNYGNAYRFLFKYIDRAKHFAIYYSGDPKTAALTYAQLLKKHLPLDTVNNLPIFDLMLLGMGDDGHTASLFSDSKGLQEKQQWVINNYVEKLKADRITLTLPVINRARRRVVAFRGEQKRKLWKEIIANSPQTYPIEKITKENTTFFIG